MSFVERELNRLAAAIRAGQTSDVNAKLRAAQQALSWAMEPQGFASPFDAIARSHTLTGIQASSEDCSDLPRRPGS
jgi:hypothetical protein